MMHKFRFLSLLLLGFLLVPAFPSVSHAQVAVGISVRIGPPPLPVYAQPICPGPRYIWVPGYWAYGPDGYYWVPGTWVFAPRPGFLWTPGWWGFADGVYVWHRGYWGPHVGFYGGINYGYGYTGVGFVGGYWRGNEFFYNRAVTNVNVRIVRNVYERRVAFREENRVSFNGRGGIEARPTPGEMRYEHEQHMYATREQDRHREAAARDRNQWESVNHGRPGFAATRRPGDFNRRDSKPARNARFNENRGNRNTNRPNRGAQNRNRNNRGDRQQKPKNRPHPQKEDRHPHGRGRGRG